MATSFSKKVVRLLLKYLAKAYLWFGKPYVIVISGTTGRFWIKEKIADVLKGKNFLVRTNKKNFNAEIGLPLSILNLSSGEGSFWGWVKVLLKGIRDVIGIINPRANPRQSEYLVLEMAIDRPENMEYLLSIVKPNLAVFTAITMIYQENFESLDEIAGEYKQLVKVLPWDGVLILNNDDERVKNLAEYHKGKTITYGFSEKSQFRARDVKKVADGQEFKIEIQKKEKEIIAAKIDRFGKHHIYAELVKEIIKENFKEHQREFFGKILDMEKE